MESIKSQSLCGTISYEAITLNRIDSIAVNVKVTNTENEISQILSNQENSKLICLMIDNSDSMAGEPITKIKHECTKFVEILQKQGPFNLLFIKFGSY